MLKQRVLTAAILIPLMLAILFYLPPTAFCLFTLILTLYGAFEWSLFMGLTLFSRRMMYVLLMLFIFLSALYFSIIPILMVAFIWWCLASVLVFCYPQSATWLHSRLMRGLMGVFVLLPCWMAINFIRNENNGEGIYSLLFLFLLIWGADSAAYFVGKKWGKTKLLPQVSPGKSLQGLAGALLFSVLIVVTALFLTHTPWVVWPWAICLSLIVVLFSVMGDLFESMMKRNVNLKDSGQILPGHGGLLDRIDSLTAAAPVFALGAILLGTYLR